MAFVIAVRNVPFNSDVPAAMRDWLGATFDDHWVLPAKTAAQPATIGFFSFPDKEKADLAYAELRKTARRIGSNRLYFAEPEPRRSKARSEVCKPPAALTVADAPHEIIRPKPVYKPADPSVIYTLPFTVAGFAFWTDYWNHQPHLCNLFSVRYGVRLVREPIPTQVRFVGPADALDRAVAAAQEHFVEGLFTQPFELQPGESNDWIEKGAKHLLLPHVVLPVASVTTGPKSVMFYSFSRSVLRTTVELLGHSVLVSF